MNERRILDDSAIGYLNRLRDLVDTARDNRLSVEDANEMRNLTAQIRESLPHYCGLCKGEMDGPGLPGPPVPGFTKPFPSNTGLIYLVCRDCFFNPPDQGLKISESGCQGN